MNTTPVSLLQRLREPSSADYWPRFVELYAPLLLGWARRLGLQDADAADVVQDVFALLLNKLPTFRYDPQLSFRAWLRTLLLNQWRDRCKQRGPAPRQANLEEVADRDDDVAEAEYRQYLVQRALRLMQADFAPATWKACWELVVAGRPAEAIADELGLTVAGVYSAKYRVIQRLKQELAGLMN
jgi:RNA polymerase sigma-70 factor, ECF subfamily